jgi:hypothetical protein
MRVTGSDPDNLIHIQVKLSDIFTGPSGKFPQFHILESFTQLMKISSGGTQIFSVVCLESFGYF